MGIAKGDSCKMLLRRSVRRLVPGAGSLIWLSLCVLPCAFAMQAVAQSQPSPTTQGAQSDAAAAQGTKASAGQRQLPGIISGTVVDQAGAISVGAKVILTGDNPSQKQEALSGENGQYSFSNVAPGPFQVSVTSTGFDTKVFSGTLKAGGVYIVPEIMLAVAPVTSEVRVSLTAEEVATEEVKEQEKQRVFGIIPNFFVSYVADAAPMAPRQKFHLAFRSVIDPFTFAAVGILAGVEQATDDFGGYGQGAEGYAKRYGAAYSNVFIGTFLGSAVFPTILKQDPRYFYRGTGSTRSRILYSLGNAVISKGDNKRWQPNYSGILGSFATGGISYLYYPPNDRSAELVVQNSLIRIAESAVAGVFQEFVFRKLTPRLKSQPPDQP